MLIRSVTAAVLIAGSIGASFANVCSNTPGKIICGSGDVDYISGNGVVKVSGTNVKGLTSVNGNLIAHNSNLLGLDVNGTASLTQCLVGGTTSIKGVLTANETKFDNSVDLYTGSSSFDKSLVKGNVNIKKTSDLEQKLYLENSSEILGDVIFDNGHGEVILSSNSKINGSVHGGTVVYKN